MNALNIIEENQKKLLNNSSVVQIDNNSYIFPFSPIDKKLVLNLSLNRYYKGPIKQKLFNIYDSDNRDFEMIENYQNKKALERLMKDKERARAQLSLALNNEEQNINSLSSQRYINLGNYKEKIGNKMYSSEHGYNIMYMLMEFLLNKPKKVPTIKINKKIDELYTKKQKDFFTKKLNKIISKKITTFKINKSSNINKELNITKGNFHYQDKDKIEEEKNIKNNSQETKSSKNDSFIFQDLKNNLLEKKDIDQNSGIFNQNLNQNKNNIIDNELIKNNDNTGINNNEQNLNSDNKKNEDLDNNKDKKEKLLFKKKLDKQKAKSSDFFNLKYPITQRSEIFKQIKYINKRKLEQIHKKYLKKHNESSGFNNIQIHNKTSIFDYQKSQRKLLLNLSLKEKEITSKAQEISSLINISYRNYKKINNNNETKELDKINNISKYQYENNSKQKITKKEKENFVKYNINNIMFKNNSNYSLSQTNRYFFGSKTGTDEIDNLKNNFINELRKQVIKKNNNLVKINLKKIVKKLRPRYNNSFQ